MKIKPDKIERIEDILTLDGTLTPILIKEGVGDKKYFVRLEGHFTSYDEKTGNVNYSPDFNFDLEVPQELYNLLIKNLKTYDQLRLFNDIGVDLKK